MSAEEGCRRMLREINATRRAAANDEFARVERARTMAPDARERSVSSTRGHTPRLRATPAPRKRSKLEASSPCVAELGRGRVETRRSIISR